jgi:hypothetical protein
MDHQKFYESIIQSAKFENRIKHAGIYFENHHIIPKCLGGSDEEENKVLLTAREHFVCHKLLTYIYKGNRSISCAFHFMTYGKTNKCYKTSRDYAYAREIINLTPVSLETRKKLSDSLMGRPFAKKGISLSEEHKQKISNATSGKNNGMYGKKHTLESIEKNRKSNTGKKHTKETKRKMSNSHKGSKRSEKTKENMKNAWKLRKLNYFMSEETKRKIGINTTKCLTGRHRSKETIEKIRLGNLGHKQKRVICLYCKKECTPSTLSRWHNDNCKFKT